MAISIIQAGEKAKAKTSDKRWQNAISRAVEGSATWILSELATSTAITTDGGTYYATEKTCTCPAFRPRFKRPGS
jgi:hypothetical protein